jgi:nucleoside-diphosphate-sugar epimerase
MPPARKSRVLVAGATGYVGQQLVEELLDRGCASAGWCSLHCRELMLIAT